MISITKMHRARRKGFTLIELLIVILVLAILMAVALPLYLGAVSDAQLKTCRANMQTIANAEAAYKTSVSDPATGHSYTTDLTKLNANLGATPKCPSGGTYTVVISNGTTTAKAKAGTDVPLGGIAVVCSNATGTAHGNFAPGIDNE